MLGTGCLIGQQPFSLGSNIGHEQAKGWGGEHDAPGTSDATAVTKVTGARVPIHQRLILGIAIRRRAGEHAPFKMDIITVEDLLNGGDSVIARPLTHAGWLSACSAEGSTAPRGI